MSARIDSIVGRTLRGCDLRGCRHRTNASFDGCTFREISSEHPAFGAGPGWKRRDAKLPYRPTKDPWLLVDKLVLSNTKLPATNLYGVHFRECGFRDVHGGKNGRYSGINLIACVFEKCAFEGNVGSFALDDPFASFLTEEHQAARVYRSQEKAFYRRVAWTVDLRRSVYGETFCHRFVRPLFEALGPQKVRIAESTYGYVSREAALSKAIRRVSQIQYNFLAHIDGFARLSTAETFLLLIPTEGRGVETAAATLARLKSAGFASSAPPRGFHRWPALEPTVESDPLI